MLIFSAAEETLVDSILSDVDSQRDVLMADAATNIFLKTALSPQILSSIWDIADELSKGYLIRREVAIALRLVGWAQLGRAVTIELVNEEGPLAVFYDRGSPSKSLIRPSNASPLLAQNPWKLQLQSLSAENKAKFQAVYFKAGPHHGVLSGQKVWQILVRSRLAPETLSQIWKLVDTQNRGDLDAVEFTVAMHLVHGMMEGGLSVVPSSLPPWLYEQAGGKPPRSPSPHNNPLSRAFTADFWTLQFHPEDTETHERIRTLAGRYFDILDEQKQGYIDGDTAVSFMNFSKLALDELGHIWYAILSATPQPYVQRDIADADQQGHLDRDAFAYSLLLIYRKLAGIDIALSQTPSPLRRRVTSPQEQVVDRLVEENRLLRTQSMVIPEATTKLLSEISELRNMITNLNQENNDLRSVLPSSSNRSTSKHSSRKNRNRRNDSEPDITDELIFEELWNEMREKEATIATLRTSLEHFEETTRQKQMLQTHVEDLQQELETLKMDQEAVQHIVNEDLESEVIELRRQVEEFRGSTSQVPSSGGDEELQMLINEELSRENATLRSQIQELQEFLEQLQQASVEHDARRHHEASLERRNRRVQRRMDEMASEHSRVEHEMSERIVALERELHQLQQRPDDHEDGQIPPPAYSEME